MHQPGAERLNYAERTSDVRQVDSELRCENDHLVGLIPPGGSYFRLPGGCLRQAAEVKAGGGVRTLLEVGLHSIPVSRRFA